ncbi:LysR family transcriptional regulator [Sessilibacter corallicola]|uniref:HTH lysR-type domain-containing protein n=1 Tax=Sessilibacter corallicola TaxID=2904075 RepID=A0ABQ0AEL1_9GAMM
MEPVIDLELLRAFVVVARSGEFKKAADILCRSQGAISVKVKRLEEQVGHCLMIRNNRGIRLTDEGETLLSYGEQLLQMSSSALEALNAKGISGKMTIGIPTDYVQSFLHKLMPLFRQEMPNLDPTIICNRSRNLSELIRTNKLDIAIIASEKDFGASNLIGSERLIWCGPKHHRIDNNGVLPIALFEESCILRDISLRVLKKSKANYKVVLTSSVMENLVSAVSLGFAVSLLPESLVNDKTMCPLSDKLFNNYEEIKIALIGSKNINKSTVENIAGLIRRSYVGSLSV